MTETTFGMVTGPNSICKNLVMFQKSYLISWGVRRMNCLSCCSLATFSIISMLIRLFTMSWMSENEYYLFRKKPAFYYTTCLIASSKLIGRSFPNIYSIWQLSSMTTLLPLQDGLNGEVYWREWPQFILQIKYPK